MLVALGSSRFRRGAAWLWPPQLELALAASYGRPSSYGLRRVLKRLAAAPAGRSSSR